MLVHLSESLLLLIASHSNDYYLENNGGKPPLSYQSFVKCAWQPSSVLRYSNFLSFEMLHLVLTFLSLCQKHTYQKEKFVSKNSLQLTPAD